MNPNEIEQIVYRVIEEELKVPTQNLRPTDLLADLNVDTDDWSFLFIPALERRLNVKIPWKEWSNVGTIKKTVELLMKYSEKGRPVKQRDN